MPTNYSNQLRIRTIRTPGEGTSDGAQRNARIAAMSAAKKDTSKKNKKQLIKQRTADAEQRKKEVMQMAKKESVTEAKTFKFTPPDSNMVKAYSSSSQPRKDLEALHDRWTKIHNDDMAKPKSQQGIHPGLSDKYAALSKALGFENKMPKHPNLGISMNTEETNTEKREKIENVARMDGAKSTSEKSTLSKTGSIKKIIEEKPTMSLPNFGLSASLIAAARQIVEKKDDTKLTGGKTEVNTDPEIDTRDTNAEEDAEVSAKSSKSKKKKLDPVGKEDDDIDNDGDVDKSDSYLKNRRKAIGKAVKEEVEDLIENTMSVKDAYKLQDKHRSAAEYARKAGDKKAYNAHMQHSASIEDKLIQSRNGSTIAGKSLVAKSEKIFKEHPYGIKEEVDQLDERENSPYERASDTALDKQYGYGTSYDKTPKTSFGRAANRSSAAYALRTLRKNPNTDTETGADAVHQGWAKTATTSTDQTPEKKARRAALASTPYSKLPDDEKEKDRVAFNAVKKTFNKESFTADELARIDKIAQSIFEIAEPGLDQNGKQKGMGMNDVTNAVLSDEKKPKKNKM
jgi:hypothetical protein